MRPNTKNSENKQKCQDIDETMISQAVYPTEDRPSKEHLYTFTVRMLACVVPRHRGSVV